MTNIVEITPSDITEPLEPVHIKYGNVKVDLPNLQDTATLPLEIIQAGIISAHGFNRLSDSDQTTILVAFLAYLQRDFPQLWREINAKAGNKMDDLQRIITVWAEQSALDPKA